MKPKITAPPKPTYAGEEMQEYHPPTLFPDIGRYKDPSQQRLYVLQMIEHIAGVREGSEDLVDSDLCVTDMLAQPSKIRNLCGRIIFGIDINPDSMREERAQDDLDPRVMGYPVRIKCIEGRAKSVKFKRGVVRDPRGVGTRSLVNAAGRAIGVSGDMNPRASVKKIVRRVDEDIDYELTDVVLGLRDAWICLSQNGEYCRRAKGRMIDKYWKYYEADENGNKLIDRHNKDESDEPEKRGPGRPRKS